MGFIVGAMCEFAPGIKVGLHRRQRHARSHDILQPSSTFDGGKIMSGFIKLHRRLRSHPLLRSDHKARHFFQDMLSDVAWRDTVQDWRGEPVKIARGQIMKSQRAMADEYGFSHRETRTILNRLANYEIIKIDTPIDKGPHIISVCNWDKYQTERHTGDTLADTQATHRRHTKEEVEEGKEERITPLPPKTGGWDQLNPDAFLANGIFQDADGSIHLTDRSRSDWLQRFGGNAERLDLALIEAAGERQRNSRQPLRLQVERTLARIAGRKIESDHRYASAVESRKPEQPRISRDAFRAAMEVN